MATHEQREPSKQPERADERQADLKPWECASGALILSDPAFGESTRASRLTIAGLVKNAAKGKWFAAATVDASTGRRAKLSTWHESGARGDGSVKSPGWIKAPFCVGVDTSQAGVFDSAAYPRGEDTGDCADAGSFYGEACALTDRKAGGWGVLASGGGVVSRSGFGDGQYAAYLRMHVGEQQEPIVDAVQIRFITKKSRERFETVRARSNWDEAEEKDAELGNVLSNVVAAAIVAYNDRMTRDRHSCD